MRLAFLVFTLANVGLPGTSGFVGEFLALIGTFKREYLGRDASRPSASFFPPAYALWLYRKVVFRRPRHNRSLAGILPTSITREMLTLAPLVIAHASLFGLYPKPILDMSAASVAQR